MPAGVRGETLLVLSIPIRTSRGENAREHWRARWKRWDREHTATHGHWMAATSVYGRIELKACARDPGLLITLTRISPSAKGLDAHDNLRTSLKGIVDQVAKELAIDDGDPKLEWKYEQRRGPWAVEISIQTLTREP